MNDTATISLVIVGAAAVAAPFVYGLLKCRYGGDKFSTTEKDHLTPAIDGETIASEANTDDMEDDGGIETGVHHGTLEPQSSPPPRASTQQDDAFFNLQETWTLAKFYFPGIVRGDSPERFKSTRLIKRFLRDEVEWKLFQLRQKDRDTFLELMKPENAATLCGKIGMNETVVQRRFKVVRSIQKELGFQSKLSIQDSLDHLISTLDAKNAFGAVSKEEGGVLHISKFNGTLYDKGIVKEHEWLSYVGVTMQQNQVESALEKVTKSLEKGGFEQFPNHFMHGTTGNKLQLICELEGIMYPSKSDGDFGSGLYCFKGSLAKALSFGADRAWPRPDGAGGSNPAIVVFPKPHGDFAEETIYHVDSILPFGLDGSGIRLEGDCGAYKAMLADETYKDKNRNWKLFVKMARRFGIVPNKEGVHVFHGFLHDCETTSTTDTDTVTAPKPDDDDWDQYCFKDVSLLGECRLFVEFHMEWGRWDDSFDKKMTEGLWDDSDESRFEFDKKVTEAAKKEDDEARARKRHVMEAAAEGPHLVEDGDDTLV